MLCNGFRRFLIGATGLLFATASFADSHGGPKIGIEYNAGLNYHDGKLDETDDVDAMAESDIALNGAKIKASGNLMGKVDYMFRYDMVGNDVEHGSATYNMTKMFGFTLGRTKINYAGYLGQMYDETEGIWTAGTFAYTDNAPFVPYIDVIGAHVNVAGKISLQLVDDVYDAGTDADGDGVADSAGVYKNTSNTDNTPAWTLQWVGNFAGWMPLVQFASYDSNNSMSYAVGVKGNVAGLGLMLNYAADNRKNFSGDREDPVTDARTGIAVELTYAMGGFTPILAFQQYNRSDENDGGDDIETNASTEAFDDNAQTLAVGVVCTAMGKGYEPFLTVSSYSGDYVDADDLTKSETKSGMTIKLGVRGEI